MIAGHRLPLRLVFAVTIAAIGLLATAFVTALASRETSERLRRGIGADLAELAIHMADKLDRGMFERWRDIQVAASLDTMRDPNVGTDAKSIVIERLRSTYPEYAAVAFMSPDGHIRAATIPQMVGTKIAQRDFFVEGSKAPFVGDVHDAILLAKILGNDPVNPPRFVDLAAPAGDCPRNSNPCGTEPQILDVARAAATAFSDALLQNAKLSRELLFSVPRADTGMSA